MGWSNIYPILPVGSCFLMDLALSHKGQGNKTDNIRPILNMVYQQRWFTDRKNFLIQPSLRISPTDFEKIPRHHRSLVDWIFHPTANLSVP